MLSLLERKIEKRPSQILLTGRILFLTEDPKLISQQLAGKELEWDPNRPERNPQLRDGLTTGEIVPADICFFDETLGEFAFTGLKCRGESPVRRGDIKRGGFVATVSGQRCGHGLCREQTPYAERAAGIQLVIAESFERIYQQNCQDLGLLTSTNFDLIRMIRRGQAIPLCEFTECEDEITRQIIEYGGLFPFSVARLQKKIFLPPITTRRRPMTLAEKIFARHMIDEHGRDGVPAVKPGDAGFVRSITRLSPEYALPPVAVFSEHYLGKEAPGSELDAGSWFPKDVRVKVPESVKVVVRGRRRPNVTVHDFLLRILSLDYVRRGKAWSKVVEFTGKAIEALSVEERLTLTSMAAEIGGLTALVAPDRETVTFLEKRRGMSRKAAEDMIAGLTSDPHAQYAHILELDAAEIWPMVSPPGDPGNGKLVRDLTMRVPVEVAHSGACTAQDIDLYAQVLAEALGRNRRLPLACRFYIQLGSQEIRDYCAGKGYLQIFYKAGVTVMEPDDGASGFAAPAGVPPSNQGMMSVPSRNFPRCGGPGQMYLASPFTVAASAVAGCIVECEPADVRQIAKAA
jgi:hypothetical protein